MCHVSRILVASVIILPNRKFGAPAIFIFYIAMRFFVAAAL
jgi:hypothetical protein